MLVFFLLALGVGDEGAMSKKLLYKLKSKVLGMILKHYISLKLT